VEAGKVEFIFMLTHHDVTIPNALEVLDEIKDSGLKCIGCKDIGLKPDQYEELFSEFRKYGMQSFLEVVTYSEEEHFRGIDLGLRIGADNIIGGMPVYTKKTIEYLKQKQAPTRFFPYVGKVTGHPCVLGGKVEEIIRDANDAAKQGANGVNLLLYRYSDDQKRLLTKAAREIQIPLLVAGNVVNFEQIRELRANRVWAFTIGGAVLEKKFATNASTREQIQAVLKSL
jgi:hypothetical protein